MDVNYKIRQLSNTFYSKYNKKSYPEILSKSDRPYNILLIEYSNLIYIGLPFRSNMKHTNGFHFKQSSRDQAKNPGLDYSKMVIINNYEYIGKPSTVDSQEFNEMLNNINKIIREARNYIINYENHVTGKKTLHSRAYERKYKMSTLPYFHEELGLNKNNSAKQ